MKVGDRVKIIDGKVFNTIPYPDKNGCIATIIRLTLPNYTTQIAPYDCWIEIDGFRYQEWQWHFKDLQLLNPQLLFQFSEEHV
jgi:hypothetical protein